jgi:hypothetical protein
VKRFAARCKLRRGGPWRLWCADLKSGERRSLIFNGRNFAQAVVKTCRVEDDRTRQSKAAKGMVKFSVSFGVLGCMIISQAFVNIHDL